MARINRVEHNKKPFRRCAVCGKDIELEQPYVWVHPRYRGRIDAHVTCRIPHAMTSSAKTAPLLDTIDEISASIQTYDNVSDIASDLNTLAEEARSISEEYQESADNQREYFPDSEQADENEEKANTLNDWADELESVAGDIENETPDAEDPDSLEREEDETDEAFESRQEDARVEYDEAEQTMLDGAKESAQEAIDGFSL